MEALNSKETLKKLVNGLKAEISEVNRLRDERSRQIKEDILSSFHGCALHIFGSQCTGIATKSSDFDIYIDPDGRSYFSDFSQKDQNRIMQHLQRMFSHPLSKFKISEARPTARVPILCVIHLRTDIACDISCRSGLSVENSFLTRKLLSSDFRVSWLVIFIKWWMDTNNLLDSLIFNSHATTWLVFFFLMCVQPNILSPVLDMKEGCLPCKIGDWDCRFNRDFKSSDHLKDPNTYTRFRLLADFFKFYGDLDFDNIVLCPLTANLIPRKNFEELTVPPAYRSYVDRIKNNPAAETLCTTRPICLQDPFDLSHNITAAVDKCSLDKFKWLCLESAEKCENWAYN